MMISDFFPWLIRGLDGILGLISTVSGVGAAGALVFVMQCGGINQIEEWLRHKDAVATAQAKSKVRRGLELREAHGVEEDRCLESLLAGLDEWRRVNSLQQTRRRNMRFGKYCLFGMVALLVAAWALKLVGGPTTIELSAAAVLAWCVPFVGAVATIWPIASDLVDHGLPDRDALRGGVPLVAASENTGGGVVTKAEAAKEEVV